MAMANAVGKFAGFVRRQWWLVLTTALVAGAVGLALTADVETRYTAQATIAVDASTMAKGTGLPGAQQLLAESQSPEFLGTASERTGVPEDVLASNMRTYTTGNRADAIVVEYSAVDSDEASRVAIDLAELLIETELRLGASVLEKQRSLIDDTESAILVLEKTTDVSPWEQADISYKLSMLRRELTNYVDYMVALEGAYTYDGAVQVTTISGVRERMTSALGAALVGLVLGLGLAMIRDRRRPSTGV